MESCHIRLHGWHSLRYYLVAMPATSTLAAPAAPAPAAAPAATPAPAPARPYIDWFVLTSKTALMQRLADLVRGGHRHYVCGVIAREKAGYFAAKMHALYNVGDDKFTQCRARKNGLATFRLLVCETDKESPNLTWYLLRTDGKMPAPAQREKWRDALEDRITLTGYELVRLTRPGAKLPAFTWRYSKTREQDLRDAIVRAIRNKRDDELRQLINTIWRTPGFAGARAQVKKFRELIVGEWRRSRNKNEAMPEIPARIAYVRRVPDLGRKLSELGTKRAIRAAHAVTPRSAADLADRA